MLQARNLETGELESVDALNDQVEGLPVGFKSQHKAGLEGRAPGARDGGGESLVRRASKTGRDLVRRVSDKLLGEQDYVRFSVTIERLDDEAGVGLILDNSGTARNQVIRIQDVAVDSPAGRCGRLARVSRDFQPPPTAALARLAGAALRNPRIHTHLPLHPSPKRCQGQ